MSIVMWALSPHPPLLIPEVGGCSLERVRTTKQSLESLAAEIAQCRPERIIIMSPHAPVHHASFPIFDVDRLSGDMSKFRCPEVKLSFEVDRELVNRLVEAAELHHYPMFRINEQSAQDYKIPVELDHGAFVPLFFLEEKGVHVPIVLLGTSGLLPRDYAKLSRVLCEILEADPKRSVVIASGDLSHRLIEHSPYGFSPEGPQFDNSIIKAMRQMNYAAVVSMQAKRVNEAGQCGYLPLVFAMSGMPEGTTSHVYSYEGPYGVGYGVVGFTPPTVAPDLKEENTEAKQATQVPTEDLRVQVAREAVNLWVREQQVLPVTVTEEQYAVPAATFVTLKLEGELRGCIGTLAPTQENQLLEIVHNAISACSRDPRFPAVTVEELDKLSYQVYVLGRPEPVSGLEELDPKRYGVIVSKGQRRGVLLPNLEGIDTCQKQVEIAAGKGGIDWQDSPELQRFEVVTFNQL